MHKVLFAAMLAIGAGAPGLVLADARDDVVRSMARCAAYTEDRQWLECYYGAAQPMRAWLGLPPAPQSQLKLLQGQPQSSASAPLPASLPSTVTRAATRSGPPPMPKRSGIFDVFGGSDVARDTPIQSYEMTRDGNFVSPCRTGRSGVRPTMTPAKTLCIGTNPPPACGSPSARAPCILSTLC